MYDVETGQRKMVEVPNDQSYEELDTQVRLIFDKFKKVSDFNQPKQNPYLPMLVYLNASLVYKNSLELAQLQSLVPKILDFLSF